MAESADRSTLGDYDRGASLAELCDEQACGMLVTQGERIVYANGAARRLLGSATLEDVLGRRANDALAEATSAAGVDAATSPSADACRELPSRLRGVHAFPARWQGRAARLLVLWESGEGCCPLACGLDGDERYRRLLEAFPDAVLVHVGGKVVYANAAAAELQGIGDALHLVGRDVVSLVHPDDREDVARLLVGTEDRGTAGRMIRLQCADGRDRFVDLSASPVRLPGCDAHQVILHDVTERVILERTLREDQERYRQLLEHSPDAVYVHVGQGRLVYANPAAADMLGVPTPADLVGRRVLDFVHPDYRAIVARRVEEAYAERILPRPPVVERLVRLDGRDLYVEITGSLLEFGGQPAVQVILRDVSERVRMERALERREAILAAVSHAAELLLRCHDWQQCVDEVLARLGEAAQVSCAYLYEKHMSAAGEPVVSYRCEWVAPGVEPMLDSPRNQSIALRERGYGRLEENLARGEPYAGTWRDVPESDREALAHLGVEAFCLVPVMVSGDWWGYLGFDVRGEERRWQGAERDALLAAADLLGAAIQRQRAEVALRQSEERFRGVFEGSQEAIVILDAEQIVLYANSAALRGIQVGGRRITNLPLSVALADVPERLGLWQERLTRVARTGRAMSDAERYRRGDQDVFAEWSITPLYNDQGQVYALALNYRDVTEQRLAERARRDSEERYRSLFESIGDAFLLFDERLWLVDYNESGRALVGVPRSRLPQPAERVAQRILLPGGDLQALLHRAIDSGERQHSAGARLEQSDGDEEATYLDLVAYRVRVDGANQVALLCRDASEARRLEAALQRSRHLEGLARLASGVAHDFGNILGVIRGECELLEALLPEGSPARDEAEAIEAMVDMGSSLTGRLIAFSRDEEAQDEVVLLNVLIRQTEHLLRRLARADVLLTLHLAEESIYLRGDEAQLSRVLVNLVTNAREAMPEGGQIRIRTALRRLDSARATERGVRPGLYALVEVSDTGRGIPEGDLERIFEPYFSTKRTGTGAGLGLSVVYGIVSQAGGFVTVRSRAGKGARFRIYLPAIDPEESLSEG